MEAPHVIPSAIVMEDDIGWLNNTQMTTIGNLSNSFMYEELDRCDKSNPFFNCTLEEYLVYFLGPKQLALSIAIPITIVYVLIFVTGLVGNVSVCVVIVRHPSMHTATNYYLFSLAVSDLTLLLLGLPNDISIYWHQYPYSLGIVFCKMRALLSEASSYVSVLTIVAFSMERYLAICHPLHLYTMSGLQRPVRIITALWAISLLCALPICQHTTIHYLNYPPNSNNESSDSAFCAILSQPYGLPVWEISFLVFFILPGAVILVLYCRMGFRIRARSRNHLGKGVKGSIHGETRQAQSRKAIIRMLAAVVIAFFVCWAPFHAQRILYIYGQDWAHFKEINEWLFSVAGWLYYVSCTVNPILYNVMSNRYRVAFRETLCCGRKHSHNGVGFSRDQSSFRETTIAANGEGSHLVRVRSVSSEPLHRSNTGTRLSRHSTLSTTLSKDYAVSSVTKTRWSDHPQRSQKWNNNESIMIQNIEKKPPKSGLKNIFSNFKNPDGSNKNLSGPKRNHIIFEVETNNLIQSDDLEMDNIRKYNNTLNVDNVQVKPRLSDSRSDSLLILSSNENTRDLATNDSLFNDDNFDNGTIDGQGSTRTSIEGAQEVMVVLSKGPANGFKKIPSGNGQKSFPLPNSLALSNADVFIDDSCNDRSIKNKIKDTDETTI